MGCPATDLPSREQGNGCPYFRFSGEACQHHPASDQTGSGESLPDMRQSWKGRKTAPRRTAAKARNDWTALGEARDSSFSGTRPLPGPQEVHQQLKDASVHTARQRPVRPGRVSRGISPVKKRSCRQSPFGKPVMTRFRSRAAAGRMAVSGPGAIPRRPAPAALSHGPLTARAGSVPGRP